MTGNTNVAVDGVLSSLKTKRGNEFRAFFKFKCYHVLKVLKHSWYFCWPQEWYNIEMIQLSVLASLAGFDHFTRIGCKARVAKEIMMHYKPMVTESSIIVGTTIAS